MGRRKLMIDEKTSKMISKALIDLDNMSRFNEEFTGVVHHLVLNLYKELKIDFPEELKNYKFKNTNPFNPRDN
jgi:Fe-S cluster assembly iron-binding protein IscA